jgi:hypothetical protein
MVVAIVPADASVYLNVNVAASAAVNLAASATLRRYLEGEVSRAISPRLRETVGAVSTRTTLGARPSVLRIGGLH